MFFAGRAAIIFLVPFILLATLAAAYPVDIDGILQARNSRPASPAPHAHSGSRPPSPQPHTCPSAEWIAHYLKSKHPTWNGGNTVFYSKPATAHSAGVLAGTKHGQFYGSLVTNNMIMDFVDKCGPGAQQDLIVPRVSEAIALLSTGTAYVIVDPAHPPAAGSIWMVNEFPTLKKHGKVHKVIQHDYATGKEHQIWP